MRCPHCDAPADFLFTASDENRGKPGIFDYFTSPCGLIFIGTIPENLSFFYEGGYQAIPGDEVGLAKMAEPESYRLQFIRQHARPDARYLEIGPWVGLVAYNAKLAGYDVSALENDKDCVNLMRMSGINAMQSNDPASTLAASPETYDVIAMWHSIEHLPRPWEVVDQAAKRLRKSGIMYIAAPNPGSAQMRLYGKKWYHLDAPRHLYFLSASFIKEIAARNGLREIERTTDDRLGRIVDRDGWRHAVHEHVPIRGLRKIYKILAGHVLHRRHRRPGDFAGAGYSLAFIKE